MSGSPRPPLPDPTPGVSFDGMQMLIRTVATQIESKLAEYGWDQPSSLWTLRAVDLDQAVVDAALEASLGVTPEHPALAGLPVQVAVIRIPEESPADGTPDEAAARQAGTDASDADALLHAVGPLTQAFALEFERSFTTHPFDELIGTAYPSEVLGVALAIEAWGYPERLESALAAGEALGPPSSYPDRRELRNVQIILRDGSEAAVTRYRDAGPEVSEATTMGGKIPAALRRTLGLPSRPFGTQSRPSARQLARQWWHASTLAVLHAPSEGVLPADTEPARPEDLIGFAVTHPAVVVAHAPTQIAALSALLPDTGDETDFERVIRQATGSTAAQANDADDWEAVRYALIAVAEARGATYWAELGRWADADLIAFLVDDAPDVDVVFPQLAPGGSTRLSDDQRAVLDRYLDPDVAFPTP